MVIGRWKPQMVEGPSQRVRVRSGGADPSTSERPPGSAASGGRRSEGAPWCRGPGSRDALSYGGRRAHYRRAFDRGITLLRHVPPFEAGKHQLSIQRGTVCPQVAAFVHPGDRTQRFLVTAPSVTAARTRSCSSWLPVAPLDRVTISVPAAARRESVASTRGSHTKVKSSVRYLRSRAARVA